jgi:hypothetical protein
MGRLQHDRLRDKIRESNGRKFTAKRRQRQVKILNLVNLCNPVKLTLRLQGEQDYLGRHTKTHGHYARADSSRHKQMMVILKHVAALVTLAKA